MSLTLIVIIIIIIIIIIVVLLMPRHATAAAAAAAAPLWTLDMFHFCQSWANLIPACRTVTFISDSLADPFSRLFCDLLFLFRYPCTWSSSACFPHVTIYDLK